MHFDLACIHINLTKDPAKEMAQEFKVSRLRVGTHGEYWSGEVIGKWHLKGSVG